MIYPIKTLSQLPLILKGYRKEKGLTQAAMAEKLGITQQSYAYFEANPASATLERLFLALRLLDVEIALEQNKLPTVRTAKVTGKPAVTVNSSRPKAQKTSTLVAKTVKPRSAAKPAPILAPSGKKEHW